MDFTIKTRLKLDIFWVDKLVQDYQCLWKALDKEAWAWFHDLWTCAAKSSWILNDFFTEKNLDCNWKLRRNWNVPFKLLERSWWAEFNGIYLVRFGVRMWEILIFNWFLPLRIQIYSQKPDFGRTNQLRMW